MKLQKGRGAQINIGNRFNSTTTEKIYSEEKIEDYTEFKTQYIKIYPKSIINKVNSPDLSMEYSMNPYQGCEHGCIYCFARNTHEYWGYGAGKDFEEKILVKQNVPELLAETLSKKSWTAKTISLSGNTDCYQPIERKEKITRKMLQVCLKYKQPVSIITKNALVTRDIDLLKQLAKDNLVFVLLSIPTLNEKIRQKLEPRTSSPKQKLKAIKELSFHNIPTGIMMGPIIPGLTNTEIFDIAKAGEQNGATRMFYTILRLNGHLGDLFTDWVEKAFPLKAKRVISLIKQIHNNKLNNSEFGSRMTGEGEFANMIHQQMKLARRKHYPNHNRISLNCDLHQYYKTNQLDLFA